MQLFNVELPDLPEVQLPAALEQPLEQVTVYWGQAVAYVMPYWLMYGRPYYEQAMAVAKPMVGELEMNEIVLILLTVLPVLFLILQLFIELFKCCGCCAKPTHAKIAPARAPAKPAKPAPAKPGARPPAPVPAKGRGAPPSPAKGKPGAGKPGTPARGKSGGRGLSA